MKLRPLDISYGQLAVFQSPLPQTFNDWTDAHVAQGFAWRPGSVSFATLAPSGPIDVEVVMTPPSLKSSSATRIIVVPFSSGETGDIEVASVSDEASLSVPPGAYRVTFEHGLTATGAMWGRLSFEQARDAVAPEVVRADDGLAPESPLRMDAVPAR